ncbi:MAG: hypothetical protein V4683_18740 [Bacteroidota bacterium]
MKKSITLLTLSTFIAVTLLQFFTIIVIGCTTKAEKVQNAETKVAQANADLAKAKDENTVEIEQFKKETADKIAANEKSINEFNARIASKKSDAEADYKLKVAELELKNTDMKKKLDDYKQNGKDNWEKFKIEFNRDLEEIGKAFKGLTEKSKK